MTDPARRPATAAEVFSAFPQLLTAPYIPEIHDTDDECEAAQGYAPVQAREQGADRGQFPNAFLAKAREETEKAWGTTPGGWILTPLPDAD